METDQHKDHHIHILIKATPQIAPYDIIPDITASSGLVKRVGGTDGYNYVPRFYITYGNMFSKNKIPNQTNAWYVYYKITDDLTNNDTQTKNQNYNLSNS